MAMNTARLRRRFASTTVPKAEQHDTEQSAPTAASPLKQVRFDRLRKWPRCRRGCDGGPTALDLGKDRRWVRDQAGPGGRELHERIGPRAAVNRTRIQGSMQDHRPETAITARPGRKRSAGWTSRRTGEIRNASPPKKKMRKGEVRRKYRAESRGPTKAAATVREDDERLDPFGPTLQHGSQPPNVRRRSRHVSSAGPSSSPSTLGFRRRHRRRSPTSRTHRISRASRRTLEPLDHGHEPPVPELGRGRSVTTLASSGLEDRRGADLGP